jgi:tetratricopeptide (TPR) repeat protein
MKKSLRPDRNDLSFKNRLSRLTYVFVLLVSVTFFTSHVYGRSEAFKIAGRDPIHPLIVEDHSEALSVWAQKGIENAILINVDAHDDMRVIQPEKIAALTAIEQKKKWSALTAADSIKKEGLYDIGSFIYAAHRLGIVSRVYWVIPFSYFDEETPYYSLRTFLKDYGFTRDDIDSFTMEDGHFKGTYNGISLVICDIESLPNLKEPLILTIDADFFPPYAQAYGVDMLNSMSRFFQKLQEKKYAVLDATVAVSVNGGYLDISRRWIVEACAGYLVRPARITEPYSERLLVYNLADSYYYKNQAQVLCDFTRRFAQKYKDDVPLQIYRAFALLANGDIEAAFQIGQKLARRDAGYAYLLADLGQCLIDTEKLKEATRFFKEAYRMHPDMNFRQKNLADALMQAKKYDDALYYYGMYADKNGVFPVAFTMGLAALEKGDDTQAQTYFDQAVEGLKTETYTALSNPIDIEAIQTCARFYRHKKMHQKAKRITDHPSFREFF